MAVAFLTAAEQAAYGRYADELPDQGMLERCFFLDDADRELVAKRHGAHNRLGFAVLLASVRHMGLFPIDVLDTPPAVIEYLAGQIGVDDPWCLKRYIERDKTRLEHQWEIIERFGYVAFASAEPQLRIFFGPDAPQSVVTLFDRRAS